MDRAVLTPIPRAPTNILRGVSADKSPNLSSPGLTGEKRGSIPAPSFRSASKNDIKDQETLVSQSTLFQRELITPLA